MKGTLYVQLDRGKRIEKPKPLECEVDLRRDGAAIARAKQGVISRLVKAQVEAISADGMMIVGVVEIGSDPFPVLRYQEWWFVPSGGDE